MSLQLLNQAYTGSSFSNGAAKFNQALAGREAATV